MDKLHKRDFGERRINISWAPPPPPPPPKTVPVILFGVFSLFLYVLFSVSCQVSLSQIVTESQSNTNVLHTQLAEEVRKEAILQASLQNSETKIEELMQQVARLQRERTTEVHSQLPEPQNGGNTDHVWDRGGTNLEEQLPHGNAHQDWRAQADRLVSGGLGGYNRGGAEDTFGLRVAVKPDPGNSENAADGHDGAGEHHDNGTIPVVVFTYSRAELLKKCLDGLLQQVPKDGSWVIYVSQDGDTEHTKEVRALLDSFRHHEIRHLINQRNVSGMTQEEKAKFRHPQQFMAYYAIAHHYKWAIDTIFSHNSNFSRILVLEEDMGIAVDFFTYFRRLSGLFDRDNSLYAISAWNDNGAADWVYDPKALYRTDFFPGLGWMTSLSIWEELSAKWHPGFWDDWMRNPEQRKGRTCIRPEISRTHNFGTQRQFHNIIDANKLNEENVVWSDVDIDYLIGPRWDQYYSQIVDSAKLLNTPSELQSMVRTETNPNPMKVNLVDSKFWVKSGSTLYTSKPAKTAHFSGFQEGEYKFVYSSWVELRSILKELGWLMDDEKNGVPRTAYRGGIISLRHGPARLHLVPEKPLYDSTGKLGW